MGESSKSLNGGKVLERPRRLSATTAKPYPGFPLTPHPSGRWCKKIRGKLQYFGKLAEPEAALERFNREWPFLKDGRTPPSIDTGDGCSLRLLCNAFLTSKKAKLDTGELAPRSFLDYHKICAVLIDKLGRDRRVDDLCPEDFAVTRASLAKIWGPVRLRNEINRARVVFKFAFDQRLIERPVHFGQSFDRPTAKSLRRARHEAGPRLFSVDELRRILDVADVQLRAMTLLGLNAGFGNSDCGGLPKSAVDLAGGWIDFPRPKTGIPRRVPLWPETVESLREAIAVQPGAKDPADADLVFLTRNGVRWVRVQRKQTSGEGTATGESAEAVVSLDALSQRFARLLRAIGITGHRNFYTLRHVFETVAGETKDQVAVDAIMGHVDPSMGAQYRERISDERLRAVTEYVRGWLFGTSGAALPSQTVLEGIVDGAGDGHRFGKAIPIGTVAPSSKTA
jgi:integrase